MLEGLSAVLWSDLRHAYGPATDVPGLPKKLTSKDPAEWVGAIDQLYGTIYHQGTLYDSRAPTIPFLVELLDYPQVKCRGKIMLFLADLIELPASQGGGDEDADPARDEEYLQYQAATYRAVWSGWKTYLRAGSDVDGRLRVSAPRLLAEMSATPRSEIASVIEGANPHQTIPATLRRWFDEEPNAVVRASQLMALGKWARHDPACLSFVREQLGGDTGITPVRLAAAMALAEHPDPPSAALEVFAAVLEDPQTCKDIFSAPGPSVEDRHDPLRRAMKGFIEGAEAVEALDRGGDDTGADEDFRYPWIGWDVLGSVLRQMSMLSARDCQSLAEPLVEMLTRRHGGSLWAKHELLRKAVFHDVDLRRAAPGDLTRPQREILTFLFEDAECWATRVVNIGEGIEAMGVPYDREVLARLLGRSAEVTTAEEAERHLLRLLRSEAQGRKGAPRPEEPLRDDHFRFLERLALRHLGSDAFMPLLHRFAQLTVLEIGVYTTDHGLAALGELPRLKEIWLNERITDQGLAELRRFPTLEHVSATASRITDAGLRILAEAKLPLKRLRLGGTAVTDGAVDTLATMDALATLEVERTALTKAGLAQLQRALPQCRIYA
jgi:hypothetical protein